MRTRSTGPCFTGVELATAEVTFGRSMTSRRGPVVDSWTLVATRRAVPRKVIAVASPRRVTRRSRMAADGPAMLIMPAFGVASTRSAST
jgi:hypothetical protein